MVHQSNSNVTYRNQSPDEVSSTQSNQYHH